MYAIRSYYDTLPTAVFFPANGGPMRIGAAAAEALIAGTEGRYMRALKSVLGTSLLNEPRLIGGKRRSVARITSYNVCYTKLLRLRETLASQFTRQAGAGPLVSGTTRVEGGK